VWTSIMRCWALTQIHSHTNTHTYTHTYTYIHTHLHDTLLWPPYCRDPRVICNSKVGWNARCDNKATANHLTHVATSMIRSATPGICSRRQLHHSYSILTSFWQHSHIILLPF
jgi:hypothetical protein